MACIFFAQFSLGLRLILQTIYVLKMEILHFLSSKSAAYKQERLQIESGLWWRAYGIWHFHAGIKKVRAKSYQAQISGGPKKSGAQIWSGTITGQQKEIKFLTFSPVHSALKFSAVLGTTSLLNSITIFPIGEPPAVISKNTLGQDMFQIDILDLKSCKKYLLNSNLMLHLGFLQKPEKNWWFLLFWTYARTKLETNITWVVDFLLLCKFLSGNWLSNWQGNSNNT